MQVLAKDGMHMNSKRIERYKAFKKFSENCQILYQDISLSKKNTRDLKAYYNLCVCPGGRIGGSNDRLLEIFYGQRPFDTQRYDPFDRAKLKVLVEYGALLQYNLMDNGKIIVVLYPAKTDHYSPIEDAILISNSLDPNNIYNVYKAHFEFLNAYMRYTSLDGEPSKIDLLRVYWLLLTKPFIIKGEIQKSRFLIGSVNIIKFALTVGLSGFLLYIIMGITA